MLAQRWLTYAPYIKNIVHFSYPTRVKAYVPSVIGWGAAVGIFAISWLEITPLARRDIFSKLPVVGSFWQNKLDERERAD